MPWDLRVALSLGYSGNSFWRPGVPTEVVPAQRPVCVPRRHTGSTVCPSVLLEPCAGHECPWSGSTRDKCEPLPPFCWAAKPRLPTSFGVIKPHITAPHTCFGEGWFQIKVSPWRCLFPNAFPKFHSAVSASGCTLLWCKETKNKQQKNCGNISRQRGLVPFLWPFQKKNKSSVFKVRKAPY